MSYSTFGGVNIIPMPSTPGFKEFSLTQVDAVAKTQSPFSSQQHVQYWTGADYWEVEFTLPPMTDAQARPWMAWAASLRGKMNVFAMGDQNYGGAYGVATGSPVFNGATTPGSYQVAIRGFTPSTTNILKPGDMLGFGVHMHIVAGVGPYNTDGSGDVTVEVWPSAREVFGDGGDIGLANITGLFRLEKNDRAFSVDAETRLWTCSFKGIEQR